MRTRYNQTCIRLHNMYAERRGPTPRSAQKFNQSKEQRYYVKTVIGKNLEKPQPKLGVN
jgi:hypothetical protein